MYTDDALKETRLKFLRDCKRPELRRLRKEKKLDSHLQRLAGAGDALGAGQHRLAAQPPGAEAPGKGLPSTRVGGRRVLVVAHAPIAILALKARYQSRDTVEASGVRLRGRGRVRRGRLPIPRRVALRHPPRWRRCDCVCNPPATTHRLSAAACTGHPPRRVAVNRFPTFHTASPRRSLLASIPCLRDLLPPHPSHSHRAGGAMPNSRRALPAHGFP